MKCEQRTVIYMQNVTPWKTHDSWPITPPFSIFYRPSAKWQQARVGYDDANDVIAPVLKLNASSEYILVFSTRSVIKRIIKHLLRVLLQGRMSQDTAERARIGMQQYGLIFPLTRVSDKKATPRVHVPNMCHCSPVTKTRPLRPSVAQVLYMESLVATIWFLVFPPLLHSDPYFVAPTWVSLMIVPCMPLQECCIICFRLSEYTEAYTGFR